MNRALFAFCLFLTCSTLATSAWTPLGTGLLSSRSMTTQNGALYVACFPSGIQKSTDGGSSWAPVNTGLPQTAGNYYVRSVGSNASWLFVGTESGVYRSDDGGASWSDCNGSLTATSSVYANRFHTFSGVTMAVFAGSIANGGGIWRTSTGSAWSIGHSGMTSNAVVHHIKQVGGTLYASSSVGLWQSTDNGLSWSAVANVNYATYALAESNGNLVVHSTFGLRYSANNGATWNDATGDPGNPATGDLIAFDDKLYALCPSPTGCIISYDHGMTWSAFNTGFSAPDAISQDELYTDGNDLYCLAILDLYRIAGTSTGIASLHPWNEGARLYPVPAIDGVHLELSDSNRTLDALLLDAQGRSVRQWRIQGQQRNWIDRGQLDAGVYRLVLRDAATGGSLWTGTISFL